jgi:UDP-N-acetylglucosamine 2-epimerase (non-hydrolysing)
VRALKERPDEFESILVHTGQHYDHEMSQIFLDQLRVGDPDHFLAVGSGTQATQTARIMEALEPLLVELDPALVLVPGDVNSTMAASLVAAKLGIPVGHIEAGLRSFDRSMPEEINRTVTDALADLLFTHSPEARGHLLAEGRSAADIYEVGNTMIDTLVAMRGEIAARDAPSRLELEPASYLVVTLHRPALVDGPRLREAIEGLDAAAREMPVVFAAHPRTRKNMERMGLTARRARIIDPLGYLEFLSLVASARGVLTDSGGIQEETTFLGIPCLTLRDNTERPVTCEMGTNLLLGLRPERIADAPALIDEVMRRSARVPDGWDGSAAQRIVDVLSERESFAGFADAGERAPSSATALRS